MNDWWEYEQQGRVPYQSGRACEHYRLFERDFDLASSWGHNAHRFSLEWSRIEPHQGTWDTAALAHYGDVVRALRRRRIEPVVTLHHFTNPAWFARRGGWLRADSPRLFARYVEYVAGHLEHPVTYWLTLNEPTIYVMQGYVNGEWPPGLKRSWGRAAVVLRNLARAHVAAYRVLHRSCRNVKVSFAHSAPCIVPCEPHRLRDRIAANIRDAIFNRAFFSLIGAGMPLIGRRRPAIDFVALNYYTRHIVRSTGWGAGALAGTVCALDHHRGHGPVSTMGWEVYPAGLPIMLRRFSRYRLPLMVTENGIATDDEKLRCEFVLDHLAALADALDGGVDVIGYLYWSLIDNFEWRFGTTAKFGMAAVDFQTQDRRARPCVREFERVCRDNRLVIAAYDSGAPA